MSKTSEFMRTFGEVFREAFYRRDVKIAIAMSEWVRNMHHPIEVPGGAICAQCKGTDWPCLEFKSADARVVDLRSKLSA